MPRYNAQTMRHYKGNPTLKCAGVQMQYSKEQILERAKCSQDPEYFIQQYMKIVHVDRGLVSFDLYPFQKDLLKAYTEERFVIAKLPRQVGKCVDINTIIVLRYKKEYIIEIKIGELYEHFKQGNPVCDLSKKLCENIQERVLQSELPADLRPATEPGTHETKEDGSK